MNRKSTALDAVDIIVLNCDNKGYIEPCLKSITANTPGRYNLIVVDQGSKDGSREWLVESKIASHLILNNQNNGAWEGRNQGLRVTKYDWVVFLDSDTEIKDPLWLDKLWDYTLDKESGMVEARVKIWNDSYRFAGFAACMIRRKVFQELGMFDHHFKIGGDIIFWARFGWLGKWKTYFCDDTDIIHHCGRTINRAGVDQTKDSPEHQHYRVDLPRYIYSEKFLADTVGVLSRQRHEEEVQRGWHL